MPKDGMKRNINRILDGETPREVLIQEEEKPEVYRLSGGRKAQVWANGFMNIFNSKGFSVSKKEYDSKEEALSSIRDMIISKEKSYEEKEGGATIDLKKQVEVADLIYDTLMGNVGMSPEHIEFDKDKVADPEIDGRTGVIRFKYDGIQYTLTLAQEKSDEK